MIRNLLAAFVAGVLLGLWLHSRLDAANQVDQVVEARREDAVQVIQALDQSRAVADKVEKSRDRVEKIKAAAVAIPIPQPLVVIHETTVECPAPELPADLVGLLNAARARAPAESAGRGDEEVTPPAAAPVEALIEADLEVVGRYHELAERHDALVEWVEGELRKQAQRQ